MYIHWIILSMFHWPIYTHKTGARYSTTTVYYLIFSPARKREQLPKGSNYKHYYDVIQSLYKYLIRHRNRAFGLSYVEIKNDLCQELHCLYLFLLACIKIILLRLYPFIPEAFIEQTRYFKLGQTLCGSSSPRCAESSSSSSVFLPFCARLYPTFENIHHH